MKNSSGVAWFGLVWQECNLAAVADAEEPYSFFTCKITC
jgi:hypothetical protein